MQTLEKTAFFIDYFSVYKKGILKFTHLGSESKSESGKVIDNASGNYVFFVVLGDILSKQKRFYHREKIRSINISGLAEIYPLSND